MFAVSPVGWPAEPKLALVCLIALVGLFLQFWWAIHYWKRIRTDRRVLANLASSGFEAIPKRTGFRWLDWVREQTADSKLAPPGRVEAEHEFNWWQFHQGEYALLTRFAQAAPLLGLVLTAATAGYFWLAELEALQSVPPNELLRRVLPLLSGVGAGAILALTGSFLQWVLAGQAGALRNDALAWFDEAMRTARRKDVEIIERDAGSYRNSAAAIQRQVDAAIGQTNAALSRLADVVENANRASGAAALAAGTAAGTVTDAQRAAQALRDEVARLATVGTQWDDQIRQMSDHTRRLTDTWVAATTAVQGLASQARSTNEQVAQVGAMFLTAVGPAATEMARATESHARTAAALGTAAESVLTSSTRLAQSSEEHAKVLDDLNNSIRLKMLPGQEAFCAAVGRFEQNAGILAQRTEAVDREFTEVCARLSGFQTAADLFSRAVTDHVLPAATALGSVPEAIGRFAELAQRARDGSELLQRITGQYYQRADEVGTAVVLLRDTLSGARATLTEMSSLVPVVANAATEFGTASAAFNHTAEHLGPAAETLGKFNAGARSFLQLAPVTGDLVKHLSHFVEAMKKATAASAALDKLTGVLNRLEVAAEAPPRRSWWRRWRG